MVYPAQVETMNTGQLQVSTVSFADGKAIPDVKVSISYTGEPDRVIEELTTNVSGKTGSVELSAPSLEYSMEPSANQPYSEYNITVNAPGYESYVVDGVEVLPGQKSVQNIKLIPQAANQTAELFVIPPHTLFGDYPPKIIESEIKPVNDTGEIVLSRVVVPEYIVVHDGPPTDASASNYYVPYRDYIKNVASSEIYATWPEDTIVANILAIQSFTLNRVYTEW